MTQILDAIYEQGAFRLLTKKAPAFAEGQRVRIAIETDSDSAEREDWLRLSASGLERAYGENEPEHGLESLREVNPEYRGR